MTKSYDDMPTISIGSLFIDQKLSHWSAKSNLLWTYYCHKYKTRQGHEHISWDILCMGPNLFIIIYVDFLALRPRQNDRHLPDDIFTSIFLNENILIPLQVSLKVVP